MTMHVKKEYSLARQMALATLLPLLVLVLSLEAYFLYGRFTDMEQNLLSRGQLIARQLAASSEYGVFANNSAFLNDLISNVLHESDMQGVVILNGSSEVLAASGEIIPGAAHANAHTPASQLLKWVNAQAPVAHEGGNILLYQPILSTQLALGEATASLQAPRQVGAVVLSLSRARIRGQETRMLWFSLLATALILLVVWRLIAYVSRHIVEPVGDLSKAIRGIGAGDLGIRVAATSHIAEINTLAAGVNRMAADLQHERSFLQQRIDEATEQLRSLAFYDTLTGLPNRRLLHDRLAQALAASRRSGRYGALMFLDLDNFKPINDRFGHAVGDMLLIEVAQRISSCLRETDSVARLGGDEFVVMLKDLDVDPDESCIQARTVAEKIVEWLGRPIPVADGEFIHECSVSIGVVLFPQADLNEEDILQMADGAMYRAKQEGSGRIHFHVSADPRWETS